jgi:diaminopimelate decarboxylase
MKGGLQFFGVESPNELEVIEKIAAKLARTAPVSLRINPDVDPKTHRYIATGLKKEKFGIPFGQAVRLYDRISRSNHLKAVGISMHLGSQVQTVKPYVEGLRRLIDIYHRLLAKDIDIRYLDLGGGWAAPFIRGQNLPMPADYVQAMLPLLKDIKAEVIVEPGRSVVGNAGVLVTRVIYLKKGYRKTFAIVDAAMNDFIRPALYGGNHRIEPVNIRKGGRLKFDVVGPICENSDTFARHIGLPPLKEGDLLCLFTAGAYGYSMSSNYNSRLRAAEVLVAGGKDYMIRERETYDDLWRKQKQVDIARML